MAYEVRICARCGEREVHGRHDDAQAWTNIGFYGMGSLGSRELCKACQTVMFDSVNAEMKHAEDKP